MVQARHDAATLASLALAALIVVLRLGHPSYHRPLVAATPRPFVPLTRPVQRPPTPAPASVSTVDPIAAPVPDETPEPDGSDREISGTVSDSVDIFEDFEGRGEGYSDDYFDDYMNDAAFQRWLYYHRRAQAAHWAEIRAARQRPAYGFLAPGNAGAGEAGDDARINFGGMFASGRSARPHVPPRPAAGATVTHNGLLWTLTNAWAQATIDPTQLCGIMLRRSHVDELPQALRPVVVAAPIDASPCTVTETPQPDGAGVLIEWTGAGWRQQARVTLGDEADALDATVTFVRDTGGGHRTTYLANLAGTDLVWALPGALPGAFPAGEVTVAPGGVARVRR